MFASRPITYPSDFFAFLCGALEGGGIDRAKGSGVLRLMDVVFCQPECPLRP